MILEAKNLSKDYGDINKTKALRNVSLKVEKGDFIGIMGPSGSGKSTLVNILSGILKPTSGEVLIDGVNIVDLNKFEMALYRRRNLGFVFQEFNLLDNLTIKENIILPMVLDKKPEEEMNNKVNYLTSFFEIDKVVDKYPYEISGGQCQRAAVARAIINDPKIIFADEPTGNLDSKSSNAVMNTFYDLNQKLDRTVLMVTHDVFAASFCKTVIFIKDGEIFMDITRKTDRKEFFDEILNCLAIIEGKDNEI